MQLNWKKIFAPTKQEVMWSIPLFLFWGILMLVLIANAIEEGKPKRENAKTVEKTERLKAAVQMKEYVYTERDFYWDEETKPWKEIIIEGVNKVHRENSKCKKLAPKSTYTSLEKGTKENPVFYVTCEPEGEAVFNFFFSKSDVEGNKPFRAAKHIALELAQKLCKEYAVSQMQNPQTVKFSWLSNTSIREHSNGRTSINSSFTASNLMGVSQAFNITCLFDETGFIEGQVTEKGR